MNAAPTAVDALRFEQRESCLRKTRQMNNASVELTRVCVIGGNWHGHGHEGANTFWEEPYVSQSLASVEAFRAAVAELIKAFPYVHYDDYAEQIVLVSDDPVPSHDDGDGNWVERKGLDVLRLVEPDEHTLREWYRDLKEWREA
jgi:hypothetical protein